MTAWSFAGQPPVSGSATTTLLAGSSFCVSDSTGAIQPDSATGLFVRDSRIVSRWILDLLPDPLEPLATHILEPNEGVFLARRSPQSEDSATSVLLSQHRFIGQGMCEVIEVRNTGLESVRVVPVLRVGADFADVLDIKGGGAIAATPARAEVGTDRLTYQRQLSPDETRGALVVADGDPIVLPGQFMWDLELPAGAAASITVTVTAMVNGMALPGVGPELVAGRPWAAARRPRVQLVSAHDDLEATVHQSLTDMAALRIHDPQHPERPVVAAGAPWFMTLFGRDSLISAWMMLPFSHELAHGTLAALAESQGTQFDPVTEEEPGRILHEVRSGLYSQVTLAGASTYYGTADATPLFVMLVGELSRWGAEDSEIADLMPHVDRALEWITGPGDPDQDGFVEYQRHTPQGLANQGWKDSWDGINFADGRIASTPIALCEVQAYCYGAFEARADLAERFDDPAAARRWRDRAEELRVRFDEQFWLPDRGWYAVGLDGHKDPIDAATSNMGHALWTGIARTERVSSVVDQLMSPAMFTGWGIRTLATGMGQYNPVSYHNGTVWPHDSAIVAAGLMRYGFVSEAVQVITGLIDAAHHFDGRLPELFCGFSRDEFPFPVPYPTACTPQAWAAAAPLLLVRTLLGLQPDMPRGLMHVAPAVPDEALPLELRDVIVGRNSVSVTVDAEACRVFGLSAEIRLSQA